ncbi:prepilin-type N-terminal cleavage/methylation domain-containing protein [Aliivibrio fischeri]|uniref:type II secretion system protein n=1 Tax=Aliivibrio fischeri TaxID=668 RepID=UPI0006D14538|nr:prepilin-type N-terminal cleavage/methylation domain-containing protein [Aliivibrio fischeri]MUK63570.1 prepilin-type N-terminal cleavage/methylation domain-containing protein [Aliivibrio fischeri]MUK70643.1 prepilin-type N-terminal cleavage/methylation domain-containing protein [Aliivibrio fischeri]MUK74063.1 prepilin-type N-terminal cleavage/methylation domain-containing protein [Aliivibrio fischeri]MUL21283.1 prepilin-type N-terminal cleavage/methylation domain-containing protein [Aliivib
MMTFPLKKNQIKQRQNRNGFTLVELIVVILLLAIIAVYTASKYMGASRFSSAAAQEQVLSILRHVQIASMQTNTSHINNACRSVHIASNQFGVDSACQSQGMTSAVLSDYSKENDRENLDMIRLSYVFNTASGAVTISELSFDLLGRPTIPASSDLTLCTQEDCRITITTPSTNESRSVCINNEGFMYRSLQSTSCKI